MMKLYLARWLKGDVIKIHWATNDLEKAAFELLVCLPYSTIKQRTFFLHDSK